jgi:hypothetical protein
MLSSQTLSGPVRVMCFIDLFLSVSESDKPAARKEGRAMNPHRSPLGRRTTASSRFRISLRAWRSVGCSPPTRCTDYCQPLFLSLTSTDVPDRAGQEHISAIAAQLSSWRLLPWSRYWKSKASRQIFCWLIRTEVDDVGEEVDNRVWETEVGGPWFLARCWGSYRLFCVVGHETKSGTSADFNTALGSLHCPPSSLDYTPANIRESVEAERKRFRRPYFTQRQTWLVSWHDTSDQTVPQCQHVVRWFRTTSNEFDQL